MKIDIKLTGYQINYAKENITRYHILGRCFCYQMFIDWVFILIYRCANTPFVLLIHLLQVVNDRVVTGLILGGESDLMKKLNPKTFCFQYHKIEKVNRQKYRRISSDHLAQNNYWLISKNQGQKYITRNTTMVLLWKFKGRNRLIDREHQVLLCCI